MPLVHELKSNLRGVYACMALKKSTRLLPFESRYSDPNQARDIPELISRSLRGDVVDPAELPDRQVATESGYDLGNYFSNGFLMISEKIAAIMMLGDLAEAQVVPVRLFKEDGTTEIEQKFYYLCLGNRRAGLVPEQSPRIRASLYNPNMWSVPASCKDDDIAVLRSSESWPDIWVDTRLIQTFFVSARIAKALSDAGVADDLLLKRCKLVDD